MVATLISEAAGTEWPSRQLGHSSSQVTREHHIAKPEVAADHAALLEVLAGDDTGVSRAGPQGGLEGKSVGVNDP
jgi:hypothetical protein